VTEKRKTDFKPQTRFRSARFFKEGDNWYFSTREGTMEGPFWELAEAENRLKEYVKILNSGFMPRDSNLELEPFEIEE
jgi:hypothetical protein